MGFEPYTLCVDHEHAVHSLTVLQPASPSEIRAGFKGAQGARAAGLPPTGASHQTLHIFTYQSCIFNL